MKDEVSSHAQNTFFYFLVDYTFYEQIFNLYIFRIREPRSGWGMSGA